MRLKKLLEPVEHKVLGTSLKIARNDVVRLVVEVIPFFGVRSREARALHALLKSLEKLADLLDRRFCEEHPHLGFERLYFGPDGEDAGHAVKFSPTPTWQEHREAGYRLRRLHDFLHYVGLELSWTYGKTAKETLAADSAFSKTVKLCAHLDTWVCSQFRGTEHAGDMCWVYISNLEPGEMRLPSIEKYGVVEQPHAAAH